jgi:hypothetical protein
MADEAVDYLWGKERSPFASQVMAAVHSRRVWRPFGESGYPPLALLASPALTLRMLDLVRWSSAGRRIWQRIC